MSVDRFITWNEPPEWGSPTLEKLVTVAQEFLGPRWKVFISERTAVSCWIVCETDQPSTYPLISEYVPGQGHDGPPTPEEIERHRRGMAQMDRGRGFEIYFPGAHGQTDERTSVITRLADDYTDALAERFTKIISRYWNGEVQWPT